MMRTPIGNGQYKLSDRCQWPACGRVLTMTAYCKQGLGYASQRLRWNMERHLHSHKYSTSRAARLKPTAIDRVERSLDAYGACA